MKKDALKEFDFIDACVAREALRALKRSVKAEMYKDLYNIDTCLIGYAAGLASSIYAVKLKSINKMMALFDARIEEGIDNAMRVEG